MAKKDKYLVGLDIGSTKTCVLLAEMDDEQVRFLALGAAESKGLRKGLIVNLDSTVSSIRRAVEEAEGVANVPVESAVIGVAGSHVRGVNSRGGASLGPRPRDIERDDVRRAIDAARNISLPEDREVLHVLPHEFRRGRAGRHSRSDRDGGPTAGSERAHCDRVQFRDAEPGDRCEQGRDSNQRHGAGATGFRGSLLDPG